MSYTVIAYENKKINLAPETVVEEVLQNIAMIITTPKFTVPLDRDFGLSQRFIDKPLPVAQSILVAEVMDVIEKYEPRAEIKNITFTQSQEESQAGKLIPRVEVDIIDG